MYQVNDVFINTINDRKEYVIKGGWDGRYPDESHCWLMRIDGTGHAYAGLVTPVKNVWRITIEEFAKMAGGCPGRFIKKVPPKPSSSEVKKIEVNGYISEEKLAEIEKSITVAE